MSNPSKTAQRFLESLNSSNSRDVFEILQTLAEELENKNDPEMTEVRLVENIYNFIEKLKIMEGNLKSYIKESTPESVGNALSKLYDEIDETGSIYRD